MTLEDHAGDVVCKARKGLGISPGQIAEAGGFTAEGYSRFEEDGTFDELPDFEKIGALIHLNPSKLTTIATGWRPRAADHGPMKKRPTGYITAVDRSRIGSAAASAKGLLLADKQVPH